VQVARGAVTVNGEKLLAGDGAAISEERRVAILAESPSEVLLFDLGLSQDAESRRTTV
jgi:redox-sensitive bicupin YhaK (pirin superfamily)